MIIWHDEGIIIGSYPLDSKKNRLIILTNDHGKVAVAVFQKPHHLLGSMVGLDYKARLINHLGSAQCEIIHDYGAHILFGSPVQLHVCHAVCDLLVRFLPEMQRYEEIYHITQHIMELSAGGDAGIMRAYCLFEYKLLEYLGYGLSLHESVISGVHENLYYVSPKSGCAVTQAEGAPYHDKLLILPPFFIDESAPVSANDILNALHCTGYFFEKNLFFDTQSGQSGQSGFSRSRNFFVSQYNGLQKTPESQ